MNPEELEYYRAVEDLFARLRGTPFLLSPKDFALLRHWWGERVPLAAVAAGLGEVFARRAETGADPVSSLSFCRHAVAKHAKRLSAAAVGVSPSSGAPPADLGAAIARLARELRTAAARWGSSTDVAAVLYGVLRSVETLPEGADPAAADEALGRLEVAALDLLAVTLPAEERARIEAMVEKDLGGLELEAEARSRTCLALRRKRVREVVGLPRLEVVADDR
jgi:hypothetical protein